MAKQPEGEIPPIDGLIPSEHLKSSENRKFSLYLHIPFCTVRCGYCDFNTYTASELPGASRAEYPDQLIRELDFAAEVLQRSGARQRQVSTVFFGGGTPTLIPAADLGRVLGRARELWGFEAGAEITLEANPDTVTQESLAQLAEAGFTRVSFGMQSAVPEVLKVLDRTHNPEQIPQVVRWAKAAGLQTSLDLIYGSPGESLADWRTSLESALAEQPDHLSTYALIVEEGTKLARQIRRGEVPEPNDDLAAEMYELTDELLTASGYHWYELSNWAKAPAYESAHNKAYWQGNDWWGAGPGAHSHFGGVRWWNQKHPTVWSNLISQGKSPAAGRELLSPEQRQLERVLLKSRMIEGLTLDEVLPERRPAVAGLISQELIDGRAALAGTLILTLKGRLLADHVVRELT